jgi:hypothetical protein
MYGVATIMLIGGNGIKVNDQEGMTHWQEARAAMVVLAKRKEREDSRATDGRRTILQWCLLSGVGKD